MDDMIQDVVDCLCWINENVGDYGGDKVSSRLIAHRVLQVITLDIECIHVVNVYVSDFLSCRIN